jgi:hypothetical protein
VYEREVVASTKAFVTEFGESLASTILARIVAQPKANGAPYKNHLIVALLGRCRHEDGANVVRAYQ